MSSQNVSGLFVSPLATRLIRKVFTLYFVIAMILSAIFVYQIWLEERQQLQNELKQLAHSYSMPLKRALWDLDETQIESVLEGIINNTVITGLVLQSEQGRMEKGQPQPYLHYMMELVRKHEGKTTILGYLAINSDPDILWQRISGAYTTLLVNAVIKLVVLWLILAWLVNKLIGDPLIQLTNGVKNIKPETISRDKEKILQLTREIVATQPDNELSHLAQSFETMVSSLASYQQHLDDLNKNLEKKVALRTQDLHKAKQQLEQQNLELQRISTTDALTGVPNRRKLLEILEYEFNQATRHHTPLSVIMVDIDFFKSVNDTYGHDVGDELLKAFSSISQQCMRKSDTFGRWGGEEFLIINANSDAKSSRQLAEKLRQNVAEYTFPQVGHKTASFGVAELTDRDDSIDTLLKRADEALYQAKENGRNQVFIYDEKGSEQGSQNHLSENSAKR